MKKAILISSLFVILIMMLAPLIGNSFMQSLIDDKVKVLESNGLKIKHLKTDASYFNTKKHFEFVLENSNKFVNYLSAYTKMKIPSYVNTMLNGATIAADIEYSNIPFSKAITLDIYPLKLSKVYNKHLTKFLASKGILYHIEYNLLSRDFNGFIKDIDAAYTLKNNAKVLMKLSGARFHGNGDVLAPKKVELSIHSMNFNMDDGINKLHLSVDSLRSSSDFESFIKYTSSSKIFSLKFSLKSLEDNVSLSVDNLQVESSSGVKDDKVSLNSKSFIGNLLFHSKKVNFKIETFNSDIVIQNLDKKSFQEFAKLVSQSNMINKKLLRQEIQASLINLFSHSLELKIKDISLQDLMINKNEDLGKMKISSKVIIKEDKDLANKLKISPTLLLANIQMQTNIKLSEAMYLKILEDSKMASMIRSYAKEDADAVRFDISFKDSALMVNDKVIK